jgi:hypothetical protein
MNRLIDKFEKFVSKDHSAGVQKPAGTAGVISFMEAATGAKEAMQRQTRHKSRRPL